MEHYGVSINLQDCTVMESHDGTCKGTFWTQLMEYPETIESHRKWNIMEHPDSSWTSQFMKYPNTIEWHQY